MTFCPVPSPQLPLSVEATPVRPDRVRPEMLRETDAQAADGPAPAEQRAAASGELAAALCRAGGVHGRVAERGTHDQLI
jgi:hypothetical protein